MIKTSRKFISNIILLTLLFTSTFFSFYREAFAISEKQSEQLIEKISRDYTKKFCNGIAFGLSKDSAMSFANKENNLIFQKKKGVDSLNKKIIANKISISVIESCGYPINLKGEEGIEKFENEYISSNSFIMPEHEMN
tara:strand:- start:307 stop:720 length:414 start_codon:yes stop_codon:yes gene_type:complete